MWATRSHETESRIKCGLQCLYLSGFYYLFHVLREYVMREMRETAKV